MRVLSFEDWLERYEDELLELPEAVDLHDVYNEYVDSHEEAAIDALEDQRDGWVW